MQRKQQPCWRKVSEMQGISRVQQKILWIVPKPSGQIFLHLCLPQQRSHRELWRTGASSLCTKPRLQFDVFYQSSIILFSFKLKKKKKGTGYFRTQLLLSTLPSLWGFSHMFIFFVPCCIHSVVQTEWKQINFNAFSGKNESTPGKPILIKAFY